MPKNQIEREGPVGWTAGPYVRVAEREAWNDAYEFAESELRFGAHNGYLPAFTEDQLHTAAWNIAYRSIWAGR